MKGRFNWKPLLICLLIMAVALLVTVPFMLIGFGSTIPYTFQILFPFAYLEVALGFFTGSPYLLNPVFGPLVALLQYPVYGYILGKSADPAQIRNRAWIIAAVHIIAAAIAIVLTMIQLRQLSNNY